MKINCAALSLHCIVLLFLSSCSPQNIIIGEYKKVALPPEREELVFHDTTNQLSLQQVLSHNYDSKFIDLNPVDRISSKFGTYWIKIRFNKIYKSSIYAAAGFDYSRCEMYVLKNNRPISIKPLNKLSWVYILSPENQSLPIIMRVQTPNYLCGVGFFIYSDQVFVTSITNDMFYYGWVIGVILLTLIYSIVMFIGIREKFYLYYFFYILSFSLYLFVSKVNVHALFNFYNPHELYYFSIPFSLTTIFLLIYSRGFLKTKQFTPYIDKLIVGLVILKVIALIVGIWNGEDILLHSLSDNIIILVSLLAGIARFRQGFKAARFFILSLSIVYLGMLLHNFLQVASEEFPNLFESESNYLFSYMNMTVLEIIIFAIAISDRHRTLKKEKEYSQTLLIKELDEKQKTSNQMNQLLELKVDERTKELALANSKIRQMNEMLLVDNRKLEGDVTVLEKDKVMRKSISFEEFMKIFSSEEICYSYLVELKWKAGYKCRKCENTTSGSGKMPYSLRCSKCGYEESPTTFTIFYKIKFPIIKAFYILFLVSERKDLSAQRVSEMILLRRQTCEDFKKKVIDKLQAKKRPKDATEGWSYLILE